MRSDELQTKMKMRSDREQQRKTIIAHNYNKHR